MSLPSQLCFGQTQGSIRWVALPNKRRQAPHEAGISCNSGGHLGFAKLSHFWGEGWVKQIHYPHELKSCVIFTYCGLKYNYFYNLSKSLGNYCPKIGIKKIETRLWNISFPSLPPPAPPSLIIILTRSLGYQVLTRHQKRKTRTVKFSSDDFGFLWLKSAFIKAKSSKINMQWFTGSIPEAILESRQKGIVFIVYIEGKKCTIFLANLVSFFP